MNKQELIERVAERSNLTKTDAGNAVNHVLDTIRECLVDGESVTLTGFGTFEVRERKAREGVRPGTTEKIQIPASKVPAFKAGKNLKEAIK